MTIRSTILSLVALTLFGQSTNAPAYRNPDLTPEKRAADLVSRMTLEEKVLQMQDQAPAIERLGVPSYGWWNEALHGVARAGEATVFPQAIGLAATWDTDLVHRVADIISTEARAKYNQAQREGNHARYYGLTFWSPNINIFRDPRWGRGQETYGEDPFLTGRMAVAFVRGMQGDDPHYFKVIATAKHYGVHSGPEPERHRFDVVPSERDLNGTYLPAFHAAMVEGKADSIMCAYNSIDGKPACANPELLETILRGKWGFEGYVVSDCGAIRDIFNEKAHHYEPNAAAGSAVAVKTGTDLTCGTEYKSLVDAARTGQIAEADIDRSLERLFVARIKLGMFDPPESVPFSGIPSSEVDSAAHRQTALEAARKSIVLLKNENHTLPLQASVRKIAVIGPSADDPVAPMGNYNGFSKKLVTPLEGIEREFAGKAEVRFAPGATYTAETLSLVPEMALMPPDGKGHGLLAEYFDNPDLQGAPKVKRVEARVYQQASMPGAAAPGRGSVRWTGTLRAPGAGEYGMSGRGGRGGSVRVFLDDKELAPPPSPEIGATGTASRRIPPPARVHLEGGRAYKLRVEYRPREPEAIAQLMWLPPAGILLPAAVEAVKGADVALVFAGLNPNLEGEEMPVDIPGFKGGDRTDIKLPDNQEKLVAAAVATGKPVVVVLTSGSALAVSYAAEHAGAVLEAWYAGEEGGTAIAETLAGTNNPAGRLPVTFYRGVDQLPPFEDYNMNGRTYRYFKGDPLYGFGYGLSYCAFQYSGLEATRDATGGHVRVSVRNRSGRDGDEVVELYMSGGADEAIRDLRGFQRVHLRAGETREVEFTVPPEGLPKGKAAISVGGGQPGMHIPHLEGMM